MPPSHQGPPTCAPILLPAMPLSPRTPLTEFAPGCGCVGGVGGHVLIKGGDVRMALEFPALGSCPDLGRGLAGKGYSPPPRGAAEGLGSRASPTLLSCSWVPRRSATCARRRSTSNSASRARLSHRRRCWRSASRVCSVSMSTALIPATSVACPSVACPSASVTCPSWKLWSTVLREMPASRSRRRARWRSASSLSSCSFDPCDLCDACEACDACPASVCRSEAPRSLSPLLLSTLCHAASPSLSPSLSSFRSDSAWAPARQTAE